jgi:hypothetical protein
MFDLEFYREAPAIGMAVLLAIGSSAVVVGRVTRRRGGSPWLAITAVLILGAALALTLPYADLVMTCIAARDCV